MIPGLKVKSHSNTNQISPIHLIRKPQTTVVKPLFQLLPIQTHSLSHLQLKSRRKNSRGFNASSSSSSEESNSNGGDGDEEDLRKKEGDELPRVNLKWRELVLDPDRDNVVAVVLTGALAWAGVHVLCQLCVVTMAILIAAIKYTFIGVVLIFMVITLL